MASRKRRLLIAGLSSAFVGILLAASFQFVSDHRWFWNAAPLVCIVALLGTVLGGLLLGRRFSRTQDTRLWLVGVGAILGFVWLATGMLAAVLGAVGMSHLPGVEGSVGWGTYSGGFLFSGAQVRFLQIAAGTGFMSGVALGLGLARRQISAGLPLKVIKT